MSSDSPRSGRPTRRFHPMMMHEMADMLGERPGDPVSILIIASMVRDDVPWLYELGMEAYRSAVRDGGEPARSALRRFQRAAEVMMRGPFAAEEMGLDSRALHMVARELQNIVEREGFRDEDSPPKPGPRRKKEE